MQFFKHLTDPALKRLYKFVLKRMIGRFLADDTLDLDQLDVHLRAGKIELCDLQLNADVLNAELCAAHALPFRVKRGYLGSVRVSIAYANIMSESCLVEVDDIEIVLVPLTAGDDDADGDDTHLSPGEGATNAQTQKAAAPSAATATSSALKKQQHARQNEPIDEVSQEGLDFVASWIEQVTSKIKVTLSNVCLRLETGEQHKGRDVALLCRLEWAQFTDESASEVESVYGRSSADQHAGAQSFGAGMQSMAASAVFGISQKGIKFRGVSMELLLSPDEDSVRAGISDASDLILHPFLASDASRQCYIQVKVSHYQALEAPAIDADIFFHSIRIVLQPQHFPELGTLIDAFSTDASAAGKNGEDRYRTAASMYKSICEQQPTWLDGDDADSEQAGATNGVVNLSFKEFERIEQLLAQYRQTHEDLRLVQRQAALDSPRESGMAGLPRKMSAAESVDSVGLSDLEDDESFFECDPGASSISGNVHFGTTSIMAQSMYASAMFGDENENDVGDAQFTGGQASLSRSASHSHARNSRQVTNRVKLHLLECAIVLLYDDLPDDDIEEEEKPSGRETASGRVIGAHGTPKASSLPSVDGMERLEFTFKDVISSVLVYPQHSTFSMNFGSVEVNEKILPRMSMDVEESESVMLSTTVLRFADFSPATGRKVHLSANISVQLRLDFKPDGDAQALDSLALQIQAQPLLFEWDMHILDRAHRYMKLLEESSKAQASSGAEAGGKPTASFAKRLDLTTDCIELSLRFPMVSSDLIRFGASSKRGLCEDKLVVMLESVKVSSSSGVTIDEDDRASANGRQRVELPWLGEFDVIFDRARVVLSTPESGNQRSSRMEEAVVVTASWDSTTLKKCGLKLRLQSPSYEDIRAAIASKKNMSQDSDEHPDAVTVANLNSTVSGDDNDGGRVGLNGWSMDAVTRAQRFEEAAADASQFNLDISIPHANIELMKNTLGRLMVLFDALLMINPIDIDGYNEKLATASARNRLQASYMGLSVVIEDGSLKLSDRIPVSTAASKKKSRESDTDEHKSTSADAESVLFSYHFAFEGLKIFQVSQWLMHLQSRAHVSARNVTLLEENGETKEIAPIIYKTPYGVSDAPILFVGVDITDQTQEMREMKVELHFSHVSLRYDVASKWLFQLLDMVLLEYPAPIIPLDSASMSLEEAAEVEEALRTGGYHAVKLAVAPKTVFTKLFVHFYDVLVDYSPTMLDSRIIIMLGGVDVSSNVVTGAVMQGFKIVAKDLQLFLTQARTGYEDIDGCILGRELFVKSKNDSKKRLTFADSVVAGVLASSYPSLLMFLEKNGFLKMVTMDFIDVFLRSLVPVPNDAVPELEEKASASTFPELSVELNLGTANIYACFDSFNTLIELASTWADQLAIEEEPKDTTAYVGLDRINDVGGVSVVTNLNSTINTTRALGTSKGQSVVSSSVSSNALENHGSDWSAFRNESAVIKSERRSISEDSYGGRRSFADGESINVLAQLDENAFGGGKHMFPGTRVATDTEARLLRTRLDEIQKQKERVVNYLDRDDEMSATQLRMKYARPDENKPRIRINELVIEDYYAENAGTGGAGAFLMEPEPSAAAVSDPWFTETSATVANTRATPSEELHPVGSLPDKSAVLHSEQAARWLPPQQFTPPSSEFELTTPPPSPDFEGFEARHSDSGGIFAMQDVSSRNERAYSGGDRDSSVDEDDEFPPGAFPAAEKNWWGLQNMNDVELSEIQTDETESAFSRRTDFFEEDGFPLDSIAEDASEGAQNAMSMSFIGAGADEGTEVELDFKLDRDLQSKFNRLMELESNGEPGADDDDEEEEDGLYDDEHELQGSYEDSSKPHRGSYQEMSSPRPIVTRQASFSSTTSSGRAMSTTSFNQPSLSPPDEPTARWFYDESQTGQDAGSGLPSRIFPHHVEIPVGGAAASLSFGEKESDDAIKSIARENAAMRVIASPPVVITHVLLRNFNICMRFFGGSDWSSDAQSAATRHALERRSAGNVGGAAQATPASVVGDSKPPARKEKLLDALLDDYVPSPSAGLFGDDNDLRGGSSLFSGAKSAPAASGAAYLNDRGQGSSGTARRRSSKSGRKTEEMLELVVSRIQLRLDMFNDEESQPLASSTVLALGDIEILDYISTSQIRKVICYWKSDVTHPRESGSSMVRVHLTTVRPGPNLCEEHRLKVMILPLRINLDQEVVSFLRQFVPVEDPTVRSAPRQHASSGDNGSGGDIDDFDGEMKGMDGTEMAIMNAPSNPHLQETNVSLGSWFFQNIDVRPCKIKIDYRPNRVDYAALRAGDYLEVINLFVLEGMELVLRRVKMSGIDGWAALGEQVLMSWVNDISRHQIHKCVASVSMPPLRPFANIGSGAADLILLPMEHYGKDRRFVRGLKKGAKSFLKSVTIETLNTASKVAQGTQALLEHADDVVSTSSALRKKQQKYRQATSRIRRNSRRMGGGGIRSAQDNGGGIGGRQYLTQQPSNATEGLYQAYDSLSRELHVAAKTIVAVPLVEYKKTGSQGYVRSVIRAVPVAVLRPMIGATEAVSKALIGVRNAVDPELKEDIENKFKDFRGAY